MKLISSIVSGLLTCLFVVMPARAEDRPGTMAMRVPDGSITVDGKGDDWAAFGEAFARTTAKTTDAGWGSAMTDRGEYHGEDDCSMTVHLAVDSRNLYVLADVRDNFLVNTADAESPYFGDDFEIFIDANPPESRYAETRNENCKQLIFVPGSINPKWREAFVWQAEQNPGVKAASRLRPWGYTIEVVVPKDLIPNWKDHPEMNSVGIDVMAEDCDAPGVDASHPAIKGVMWLLRVGQHFQTSALLGELRVDENTSLQATHTNVPSDTDDQQLIEALTAAPVGADGGENALVQQVLDEIGNDSAGRIAAAAIKSNPALIKAGLFILSQRPELPLPEALHAAVRSRTHGPPWNDADLRKYAMLAIARRGSFKDANWFDDNMADKDPATQLTALYCAGISGDETLVPKLIPLLKDPNLRIRMMAAMALGMIGDGSAVPALQEMAQSDAHSYAQRQATMAIEEIGKAGE